MSLGLFNCRLIQPAGDQLFFFSAVLPRRCQFGQALSSLLVTRPARPRPTGGRRMLLVFPSQKDFVLVFRGAKSPRAQKGSLPTIHPRISPKIPQSYPQIPLQTRKKIRLSNPNAVQDRLETIQLPRFSLHLPSLLLVLALFEPQNQARRVVANHFLADGSSTPAGMSNPIALLPHRFDSGQQRLQAFPNLLRLSGVVVRVRP